MVSSKYENKQVKVTKLTDLKFDGVHPNGINPGTVREGQLTVLEIGQSFTVVTSTGFFWSSIVEGIEVGEKFDLVQTVNSVYKIEII